MISCPSQVNENVNDNRFLASAFSYSNYYWANFIQFYSHNVMIDPNGFKLIEGSYVLVSLANTSKWYVYDRFNNSLDLYKYFRIPIECFYPTQIMCPIDYLSNKVEYQNRYLLIPVCVVTNPTENLPMSVPSSRLLGSQSFGSSDSLTNSQEFNTENQFNPVQVSGLKPWKRKNKRREEKKPKTPIFGAIPDIKPKPDHVDLTYLTIFTLDSPQAKMLDDAISIKKEGDIITFGIHCIDYCDQTIFSHLNATGKERKRQIGLGLDRKRPAFSIFVSYNSRSREYTNISYGKTYILIKAQLTSNDYQNIIKCRNIEQTNSILNGKLSNETTAEEIHECCLLLSELMPHINGRKRGDVICVLGRYISKLIANFLISTYGEYAIYVVKNGENVSTFRSPLRKPRDVLVLKQIEAARNGFSVEEMTFYVLNVPPDEFKNAVPPYERRNKSKKY
ncbi:RNB domain-containing protein [Entamoeba marina]